VHSQLKAKIESHRHSQQNEQSVDDGDGLSGDDAHQLFVKDRSGGLAFFSDLGQLLLFGVLRCFTVCLNYRKPHFVLKPICLSLCLPLAVSVCQSVCLSVSHTRCLMMMMCDDLMCA